MKNKNNTLNPLALSILIYNATAININILIYNACVCIYIYIYSMKQKNIVRYDKMTKKRHSCQVNAYINVI